MLLVALLEFAVGLGGDAGPVEWHTCSSSLLWSGLGLAFFFVGCTVFAFGEHALLGFSTRFQWVANRRLPPQRPAPRRFIMARGFGTFIAFGGLGLTLSSVWQTTHEFWLGFPFIGSGAGLWLGVKASRRILKLSEAAASGPQESA